MRRLGVLAAALALALVAVVVLRAHASATREHLTGIVLMAPPGGPIVVHHEAFGGMPAMSMEFAVPAGTVVHPGDRIVADVDRATDPWTLSAIVDTPAASPSAGTHVRFLGLGERVPPTPFVDQHGTPMTLDALRGRPYALAFIYTRCRDPHMCPLVSAKIEQLQRRTAGTNVALVEVSLDPAYDRPPVLARYAAAYGADPARWHLLTGDPRTVLDFAARFRILERSAGPTTIVHTERLVVVDPRGHIAQFYDDAAWPVDAVARSLRDVAPASAPGRLDPAQG